MTQIVGMMCLCTAQVRENDGVSPRKRRCCLHQQTIPSRNVHILLVSTMEGLQELATRLKEHTTKEHALTILITGASR